MQLAIQSGWRATLTSVLVVLLSTAAAGAAVVLLWSGSYMTVRFKNHI